jgi:tetratricopeptide (TPR) repeat protein
MAGAIADIGHLLALINSGGAHEALAILDPILAANEDDHRLLFLKGEALLQMGRNEEAEHVLARTAALLAEPPVEILYRLGVARLTLKRSDAADVLVHAVERYPGRSAEWMTAGSLALEKGMLPLAERLLRAAAEAAPDPLPILLRLVDCLTQQDRADKAIEVMATVLRLDPTRYGTAEQLVHSCLDLNDRIKAEDWARKLARQFPDSLQHVALLGWLYRSLRRFDEAVPCYRMALALLPGSAMVTAHLGATLRQAGHLVEARSVLRRALDLDPNSLEATIALADTYLDVGDFASARDLVDACDERISFPRGKRRSVVIPVLDYSPGSPHTITTLLDDLAPFDGEVICIFNGDEVFEDLRRHPRIDKWSYNKFNVGVGRGWNMGIQQAEGDTIHILNADLKITVPMLYRLETWLHALPDALCVGVSAHWMDYDTLRETKVFNSGGFDQAIVVDQVSGQLFSLHARRLHDAGITFDPRLSPYFGEETDLAFKARQHGLRIYAVPETDFSHSWGISKRDRPIQYFGRPVHRLRHMTRNQILLQEKWDRIKRSIQELTISQPKP